MIINHICTVFVSGSKFTLLSTEPNVIRWALDEIHEQGGGHVFSYGVYSLDVSDASTEFGLRFLAGLVRRGWVVFAASGSTYHLQKQFDKAAESAPGLTLSR
jgi:hypothetical protein